MTFHSIINILFKVCHMPSSSNSLVSWFPFSTPIIHHFSCSWISSIDKAAPMLTSTLPTLQINHKIHPQTLRVFKKLHFFSNWSNMSGWGITTLKILHTFLVSALLSLLWLVTTSVGYFYFFAHHSRPGFPLLPSSAGFSFLVSVSIGCNLFHKSFWMRFPKNCLDSLS